MIIDGKKIAESILSEVKNEAAKLKFKPVFCDILVGENPVSAQYVKMKGMTAQKAGIEFLEKKYPDTISTEDLIKEINFINNQKNISGLIVQLPLPGHLDKNAILNAINPRIDVDCIGQINSEKFFSGKSELQYPTALAIMAILKTLPINLNEKSFLVIGQGQLVGKPISNLIQKNGWKMDVALRDSPNKKELLKNADVVISATGNPKSIISSMIKEGAVIIDAGTSETEGGVAGDVDFESVSKAASYLSPVPGGVGPVTVAMLLSNVVYVAKSLKN